MADDTIPMTREGFDKLRADLERYRGIDMIEITKRVATAREMGDLSENAEYHAAREQQGFIEGRISEIESRLSNTEVIDVMTLQRTGRVVFGVTVELESQSDGARVTYQIVGEDEADIRLGLIAVTSPIARALVGKQEGDIADVAAPGGVRSYEIVAVRYE